MQVQQQVQVFLERSEDYKKALALEKQILTFSGLEINKQLHIYDVPVLGGSEWIHTICCGHDNASAPPILIMHGYCNTLTSFFRMLAPLSKVNKVYVIDLPGMGLSSRPEFTLQGAEPVVEYFVSWIESWRETLNIDRLIIVGHSFGGYIAGMYAAKYPERILNLHLISPIGITHVDRDQLDRELATMESQLQWYRKLLYNFLKNAWHRGESVNSLCQKWWTPSGILIDKFVEYRLQLKNHEAKSFKQLYKIIFRMPASCNKAIQQLFHLSKLRAIIPLQRELPNKILSDKGNFNVHFYFGDADWMDPSGARALNESQTIKCTLDIIPKSGHNINIDQPQILSDLIIKYNKEISSI